LNENEKGAQHCEMGISPILYPRRLYFFHH
jgi:hypothetical protein